MIALPCLLATAGCGGALTQALPDVRWSAERMRVDIDCDGRPDRIFTGRTATHYVVAAVTAAGAGTPKVSHVAFALSGNSQDSLCGDPEPLRTESLDYDPVELIGEEPEGFIRSKDCAGLQLRSGDCDSFHVFWNHRDQELSWWRL